MYDVSKQLIRYLANSRLFFRAFIISVLATLPITAFAQAVLEEVVVTARKREEGLNDVPIAITAMSGDFMQDQNLSDFAGLADQMPNVSFGEAFNSSDRFAIRGISTNGSNIGFEQAVGFNVDGFYFGRSRFGQTMFLDLERVEILKGPQNTLIGKNNTAGAINIVTRKPGEEAGGYLATTVDFDNAEGFSVEGAYDIPLSDNVKGRVAARIEDRDGYMEQAFSGEQHAGAKDNISIRGNLVWDITPDFDATLLYQYGDINRGSRAREISGNCNVPAAIDDCTYNNVKYGEAIWAGEDREGDYQTETIFNLAGLNLNWNLNDNWTLTSLTNFMKYEGSDIMQANFDANTDTTMVHIQDEFEQLTQEVRLLGSVSENIDVIAGIYHNDNTVYAAHSITFCGGPGGVDCSNASLPTYAGLMRNWNSTQDSKTYSAFGQIDFHINETLTLGIGGRYTTEDKAASGRKWVSDIGDGSTGYAAHQTGGGTPLPGTDYAGGGGCRSLGGTLNGRRVSCYGPLVAGSNSGNFDRSENDFSPNVVLAWRPSDEHMLYINYAEGFKGGGYQLWPVGGGALLEAAVDFEGESAKSLEVGGKHTLLDNTLQLNWSAWNTEVSNLQVSAFDPQITAQNIVNAGQATSQGIEADVTFLLGEAHRVIASAAYLDGIYDSYEGANCLPGQTEAMGCIGGVQDLSGDKVPFSPEYQFNLAVDGSYPIGDNLEWGWRAAYNWRDDQFIGTINHPVDEVQASYGKVDFSLSLSDQDGDWTVSLIGLNLTDENVGNAHSYRNDRSRNQDPTIVPNNTSVRFMSPGRQVALQGSYNF